MKNLISFVFLAVLATTLLGGCPGGDDDAPDAGRPDANPNDPCYNYYWITDVNQWSCTSPLWSGDKTCSVKMSGGATGPACGAICNDASENTVWVIGDMSLLQTQRQPPEVSNTHPGDEFTCVPAATVPDAGPTEPDANTAIWANLQTVIPGTWMDNADSSTRTVNFDVGAPTDWCASGASINTNPVCVDDPETMSLSYCKNGSSEPTCAHTGTRIYTGKIYLCDCGALEAKFGAAIGSWCQTHYTSHWWCGNGGVVIEYTYDGVNVTKYFRKL